MIAPGLGQPDQVLHLHPQVHQAAELSSSTGWIVLRSGPHSG